ncbi:unnamed protein product [Urochloa humidicola]
MSLAGDGMSSGPATTAVSVVTTVAASGYHLLAVGGYARIKESTPNARSILSRPFIVGGYRWRIKFYPNGYDPENANNLSLSLLLDEGDAAARALDGAALVQLRRSGREARVLARPCNGITRIF